MAFILTQIARAIVSGGFIASIAAFELEIPSCFQLLNVCTWYHLAVIKDTFLNLIFKVLLKLDLACFLL